MANNPQAFQSGLLEFYKESYNAELETKEKFSNRLTFNLGILTILANITVSYLTDAPALRPSFAVTLFYSLFGLAAIWGLTAIIFFSRALGIPFGHPYAYIPSTNQIEEYVTALHEYNEGVDEQERIDVEVEFRKNLMDQYSKSAAINAVSNRKKTQALTRAMAFSALSLICLLISAAPFFALKFSAGKPAQKVEITTPVRIEATGANNTRP